MEIPHPNKAFKYRHREDPRDGLAMSEVQRAAIRGIIRIKDAVFSDLYYRAFPARDKVSMPITYKEAVRLIHVGNAWIREG